MNTLLQAVDFHPSQHTFPHISTHFHTWMMRHLWVLARAAASNAACTSALVCMQSMALACVGMCGHVWTGVDMRTILCTNKHNTGAVQGVSCG